MSADEQTARDSRKYEVSSWMLARVERLFGEIKRRLMLPGGSPIDPERLLGALQCAREGRNIRPGHYEGLITLYPYATVPVPMYIWAPLAWMHTDMLGIMWQTRLALNEMRVFHVGTLLLHTEQELTARCNSRAVTDVKHCLRKVQLRLPTAEELAAAKAAGFWVELPDGLYDKYNLRNLRIATKLAPLVPVLELHQLRGSRDGFFDWARMVTLGDVLGKTETEIRELWEDYVFYVHTAGDSAKEDSLSEAMGALLCSEAATLADATISWVHAAGLKFAGR